MTRLSIIIPTRDRPDLLRDTLRTLAEQDVPPGGLEVVIVDDGSARPLEPLVRELSSDVPMRCERQDPHGLNVARNRGAAAACGELLAYLDDDVLVPPEWATALVSGFDTFACDAIAGRIALRLAADPPPWLTPKLRRYLSELDLGDTPKWLGEGHDPFGANCAVTRSAFERAGGFGAELDREGTSLRSNGDVEFFRRLRRGGGRIAYWPTAVVEHRVPADRLTVEWFRRRAFAQGHSDVLLLLSSDGRRGQAVWTARELVRFGRAAPILVRNVMNGRGVVGSSIWLAYCRGRLTTLQNDGIVSRV